MQLPASWITFTVLALAATPISLVNAAPIATPPTELDALKGVLGKRLESTPLAIRAEPPSSEQTAHIQVHSVVTVRRSTLRGRSPEPEPSPEYEELEKRFGFLKGLSWAFKGVKAVAGMFNHNNQ